ncbi:hypothetical protein D3C75_851780 [compost metagenome]
MLLIGHLNRRTLPHLQADDRRLHIRLRDKHCARHNTDQLRLAVILHGNAQAAIFLAARGSRHTLGNLLLDHDDNIIKRKLLLQQFHEDRRRHIIRQIGNNTYLLHGGEIFSKQLLQIHFKYIIIAHFDMRISGKHIPQYRDQPAVNFYRSNCSCRHCEPLC